jgi:hypothetical protein
VRAKAASPAPMSFWHNLHRVRDAGALACGRRSARRCVPELSFIRTSSRKSRLATSRPAALNYKRRK